MGKPAKKYYAVARGFRPGIYSAWFGAEGAEKQVRGFAGALYRGFASLTEAQAWLETPSSTTPRLHSSAPRSPSPAPTPGKVAVYTDGSCRGNPGRGGYGAIIVAGGKEVEIAAGYRLTTNNRMELMACIAALETLAGPSEVVLYSDSRYVVNAMSKGWAQRWRANRWMRTKSEQAENSDLWARLLELCDRHRVEFVWVHGHAGHPENERCDALATAAATGADLQEDRAYVRGLAGMPGVDAPGD